MRKRSLLPAHWPVPTSCAGIAAAAPYVPDQVLVKYKDDYERRACRAQADTAPRSPARSPAAHPAPDPGRSVGDTDLAELRKDPDVAYAVPNYKAHIGRPRSNDPASASSEPQRSVGINMPVLRLARQASPGGGGIRSHLDTAWRTELKRSGVRPTCASSSRL